MAEVGDACRNGAWEDRWTCPACYHDHRRRVIACDGCGTALGCTVEREPVPVCTIVDPADRNNP